MRVADWLAERFIALGVRHVFGVGGANIEDLFAAVQRRRPEIRAVLDKHEHAAGTAADAYARLRGLGIVMVTSGGGAMNLVHSLAEARASRVPVIAVVGEPPTELQGRGAFQDSSGKGGTVDALALFKAAAQYAARAESAADLPGLFDRALEVVLGPEPGPAALLVAKDLQTATITDSPVARPVPPPASSFHVSRIDLVLQRLDVRPIVIIAGEDVRMGRAQQALARLAVKLDASVATTPDARDAFDNRDARYLGVSGAMGHEDVARALESARTVLLVGTALPFLARQGLEPLLRTKAIVSLGSRRPFVEGTNDLHWTGPLDAVLSAIAERLPGDAQKKDGPPRPASEAAGSASGMLTARAVVEAVARLAPDGSVILVDAGNTGANAVHHLRLPPGGQWLLAMGMAGMGYTFGAATGAAFATGKRCIALAGDGAFFMNGMEIHTAVEHSLPITYVLLDNGAHGMCLVRERLLLGENAGYNTFRRSHIGAGLAAMFPGLVATDCTTLGDLERAVEASLLVEGPSVVCAELRDVEVPPFAALRQKAPSMVTVPREGDDDR